MKVFIFQGLISFAAEEVYSQSGVHDGHHLTIILKWINIPGPVNIRGFPDENIKDIVTNTV